MRLEEHILEISILVLMESDTESRGKLFLSVKISSYLRSYFWSGRSILYIYIYLFIYEGQIYIYIYIYIYLYIYKKVISLSKNMFAGGL